jgi:hypothetical protein
MGAWGGNAELVASPGDSPAWAPHASPIAYFSLADDQIHTVRPSGQGDVSIGNPVSGNPIFGLDWQPR